MEALPKGYRYALERHLSPMLVTAGFVYVRLHGPGNKYEGSYTEESLQAWGARIKKWQQEGKDVYFYFDNDQLYAVHNARRLRELVQEGQ